MGSLRASSRICWAALACAAFLFAADVPGRAQSGDFVPVTDAMLQDPDPADWLMWRRTLDGWGYSPLDSITRENVGDLRMVWTRAMTDGTQEGTPLAYDGVLYMPNPFDVIQAIDAVTGDLLWEYRRDLPDDLDDYLFAVATNRNIAIHGNLIIDNSADDYVYALDATTGELAWETEILDYRTNPANQTSGPIVANGRVVSGRSCMPQGGPDACVITAHDAATGEELWRRRLIPGPGEPGDETWGEVPFEQRAHVGSWMVPSYDPELDLVYVGTSVTSPAPKFLLGGTGNTHLYHNSTLALDGETGEIRWYYQHLNDHWDLDHPFERILVDTAVAPDAAAVSWINPRLRPGEERKVVTGIPGKTGVVYTLDRETGEFLWATPTITQNVISNIDGATGRRAGELGGHLHGDRPGGAGLPDLARRQGLGGGRVQSADQHDVLPAPQRLRADDGDAAPGGRPRVAVVLAGRAQPVCPRLRRAGHRARDLGGNRGDGVAVRPAGDDDVARRHGWRPRLRGRCQRSLPGLRPRDGRDPLGDQPRLAGHRFPDHLCRRRPPVRRGEHRHRRHLGRSGRAHARTAPEPGEQSLRLRAPGARSPRRSAP